MKLGMMCDPNELEKPEELIALFDYYITKFLEVSKT